MVKVAKIGVPSHLDKRYLMVGGENSSRLDPDDRKTHIIMSKKWQISKSSQDGVYVWTDKCDGSGCTPLKVGVAANGDPIFAGRAYCDGHLLPAKVTPSQCAYVAWNGKEHPSNKYEVLCDANVDWIPSSKGKVPTNAVCVGKTKNGECLFMGRVKHEGNLIPGMIYPNKEALFIPYDGKEIRYTSYDVMVSK